MTTTLLRVRTDLTGPADSAMLNTFYFNWDTTTPSDARSVVNDFWTALTSKINQNVHWTVEQECEQIDPATGTLMSVGSDFTTYTGSGSEDNDPLPWSTQGLVQWHTAGIVNGHRVHGRTFIPGACEEHSNGNPDSGYLSALVTAGSALTSGSPTAMIWARPVTSGPHTRAGSAHNITSHGAWGKWAVLRHRRG